MNALKYLVLLAIFFSWPVSASKKIEDINIFVDEFLAAERVYYAIFPGLRKICVSKNYNESDCLKVLSVIKLDEIKPILKSSLERHLSDKESKKVREFSQMPLVKKNAQNELFILVKSVGMQQVFKFNPLTQEEIKEVEKNEPNDIVWKYTQAMKDDFSVSYLGMLKKRIAEVIAELDKPKK